MTPTKRPSPTDLQALKISQPAHRALAGAGIKTLAQLARRTEAEVLALHGIGPSALPILRKALKAEGLAFKAPVAKAATKSAATKSAATKSAATKSAATKSAATKSAATKSAATKSPAAKSAAAKSAAAKSAAAKSAAAKSTVTKPATKAAKAAAPAKAPSGGSAASTQIDAHIASLGDWRGTMITRFRKLVRETVPSAAEEFKWGTPVWALKGNLVAAGTFKDHVKLNFFKGAALGDPHRLFNAGLEAKGSRGIDLFEGDALNEPALRELLQAAVALNAGGG